MFEVKRGELHIIAISAYEVQCLTYSKYSVSDNYHFNGVLNASKAVVPLRIKEIRI